MEKTPPQYDIPTPTMVPTVQASRHLADDAAGLKATRIRSTALFFTAVLTTAVVVCGLIGAAVIFRGGHQNAVDCPPLPTRAAPKLSDSDMDKNEELVTDDGERLPEHITYDRDANTLMIETPAEIRANSSAATYAVDFDRSVVYVSIHDQNICLGYTLTEDMKERIKEYLDQPDESVLHLSTAPYVLDNYEVIGELPKDYVKTNGAIIQGLCAGRDTYWAVPSTVGSDAEVAAREKRGTTYSYCYYYDVCSCSYWCSCTRYRRCIYITCN